MANQRERQAIETKSRILAQVFDLFSTTDYEKIRMVDIARCAGVSVGTLYLYFQSKSDLVTTYIRERNDYLSKSLKVSSDESVESQYNHYIDVYLNTVLSDGYEFTRAIQLAMIEQHIGHNDTNIQMQNESLVQLIELGFSTGELKAENGITAQQFFEMFIGSINGALVEWLYTGEESLLRSGMDNTRLLLRLLQ